ncbi:MAG: DsbA family oxidoreductase [Anaerolineales bacterium]|nr:DsbA family oxidoreductase [Anaerolineales bacterium]MCW5854473.1 DsbA family oxidoreductase [Anaerolineales bacterium]
MKIDIWSDIGCPFCYLGTTQLNEALAGFEHRERVEISHHSFQLDPNAPRQTDMRVVEMLANKRGIPVEQAEAMNQQVAKAFEASGLSMNYKEAQPVNTFDAHRLVHFAASQGQQEAVLPRLFKAYFTDGENTADVETLVRLASEAGLDAEQTRAMLASDQYAAEVQADISRAAQLGIHGVPFFIFEGKYAISGAQGAEAFNRALQQVWEEVHSA